MTITNKQRDLRRRFIGASDMPALLGCDPFQSAGDVYLSKTADLPAKKMTRAMERGVVLEPGLIAWAKAQLGTGVANQRRVHRDGYIAASLDFLIRASGEPCECKTTLQSKMGYEKFKELRAHWGEPGTDQVPDNVVIQVMTQLACLRFPRGVSLEKEIDKCHIAVLIGLEDPLMYVVDWDPELGERIVTTAKNFMLEHVIPRNPPAEPASVEIAKTLPRERKTVNIDPALVTLLALSRTACTLADKAKEKATEAVYHALGNADEGIGGTRGSVSVTSYQKKNKVYAPDAPFTINETTVRKLNVTINKEGKK